MTVQPDSIELADAAAGWRSCYVHIPFCARRCPYCDFAVVAPGESDVRHHAYIDAVIAEIELAEPWAPLDAISFGGGTPSTLRPALLASVLDALRRRFGIAPDAEIALEANPEDWTPQLSEELAAAGFGRVSFGAQSFDADVLRTLGRLHTPEQISSAVSAARVAGFDSINLDLIFGTPGESLESWRASVEAAIALAPDHVSTYSLTVERGTELSRAIAAGAPAPDPDVQADQYELADELLARAGFVRYEVSNHARSGHHVRYNLCTWAGGEYLGFGMGAHGHRDGVRTRNLRRLDRYVEAIQAGLVPRAGDEVVEDRARERVFLGLRRTAGVAVDEVVEEFLAGAVAGRLLEGGVISIANDRLVIDKPLLADAVMREFVD